MSVLSPYPNYSRGERFADALVHCLGIGGAICGVSVFLVLYTHRIGWDVLIAMSIYAAGLLIMLIASAVYHICAHTAHRALLRRIDHAAIFLKIAATVTPLAIILGNNFAYIILALVWILAGFGAVFKLRTRQGAMSISCWPYMALGWLGLLVIIPLFKIIPTDPVLLLLVGGVIYSAAVIFYWWDSLAYANAIWHGCIVIASGCFFSGITMAITSI